MMRIAVLTQSYPPMISGAALVVDRLARGLAARGHQVLVLAASDEGRAYTEEYDTLKVVRLRSWPNPFRVGQYFLLWPQREVESELRAFNPDVIHTHDPLVMALLSQRATRLLGRPVPRVLTLHQLPWFASLLAPSGLRRQIESAMWWYGDWVYPRFDIVVSPSRMIADIVAEHAHHRPLPISNGVDIFRFTPEPETPDESAILRRKYRLDPERPIILYAGRVDVDKRVDLAVRAVALAMQAVKTQLLIVGDGKQLNMVKQLTEELGIQSQSSFPGYVPLNGDLPGLYRLASVFVTASEIEIQSSVVLEAAASGLPIVAVRASSMPEFVHDGVTGYLVPPGDVTALAERLGALLQNPGRAKTMGEAALAVAREHSNAKAIEAYERLYESLIRSKQPAL